MWHLPTVLFISLIACQNKPVSKQQSEKQPAQQQAVQKPAQQTATKSTPQPAVKPGNNSIKAQKNFKIAFSDLKLQDTFRTSLSGAKADNSVITFEIIAHNGKKIYQVQIPASEILKANPKLKSETDKLNFLKNEVNFFFEEDHFLEPAVMPDEKADKNVPDKNFHNELKESKLTGFNYRTGEESTVYIAWSQKEQKVKVYYKCCP